MQNDYIKLDVGQCHASMFYHLVWATRNKAPYILNKYKKDLYNYIAGTINRKKWLSLSIGGSYDHIHILIKKRPVDTICKVVCCIKSNSSKFMRDNFNSDFAWQNGYGVFTVDNLSLPRLKKYVANQEVHHEQMSFEEEYALILKRYNTH